MTVRKYSSVSQETTLTSALSSGASTMVVASSTALLGGITLSAGETFVVVVDPDTALEEIVEVISPSSSASNTLTVTRPVDGTAAIAHSAGAKVRHMAIGRDFREANNHIEASSAVHGLTGSVVGTTDTQTLTNKTLTSPTITGTGAIAGTFTGNLTGNVTGTVSGNAGTVTNGVYTTDTGTVTSTMIANGTIVNADINASAAIDKTKISGTAVTVADTGTVTSTMIANDTIVNADINSAAAIDKTKISGTAITAADTGTVTSTMIANDTIVNADINSSAQIAYSKTNLTNSIVNADINASAAIEWTKIAPSSTVSSTELGYLDGVTSAIQTQIDSKLATSTAASTYAPLASPALTGVPTAPTAAANTNTTQVATTAYVQTEINDLIASAPGALDTLNELAAALGNDASFSTTVTNSLATKLPLAGGTMSGAIAMGTNKITGLGTPSTSTDAATKGYVDTAVIAPSNLTGPITSVGNATSIASQTGTGTKFVVDQSPTIVTPTLSGNTTAGTINNTTIPSSKTLVATDSTAYVVPSQTGNSGKYLTTDGSTSSWGTVQALPTQTGNSGKYLTTDGSSASWGAISGSLAQPTEPSSPTDGLVWVDTDGTALINQLLRWSKAPANGTTTLSGNDDNSLPLTYSVGYEQVFQNGALLARGSDYTATNGTSISLTNASVTGDIFEVFASQPVAISDVYTQTQANAAFIGKSLTTTTGDIIYASSANTPARLGIGSSGQVLQVSGGIPSWATLTSSPTFAGCSAQNSTGLSISSATWTAVTLNSEEFDTDGYHSTSSNTSRMTIPTGKAGKYFINGIIRYEGYNGWHNAETAIYKNGSKVKSVSQFSNGTTGGAYTFTISGVFDAAVGDYFEFYVWQNSSVSRTYYIDSTNGAFQIAYLGA